MITLDNVLTNIASDNTSVVYKTDAANLPAIVAEALDRELEPEFISEIKRIGGLATINANGDIMPVLWANYPEFSFVRSVVSAAEVTGVFTGSYTTGDYTVDLKEETAVQESYNKLAAYVRGIPEGLIEECNKLLHDSTGDVDEYELDFSDALATMLVSLNKESPKLNTQTWFFAAQFPNVDIDTTLVMEIMILIRNGVTRDNVAKYLDAGTISEATAELREHYDELNKKRHGEVMGLEKYARDNALEESFGMELATIADVDTIWNMLPEHDSVFRFLRPVIKDKYNSVNISPAEFRDEVLPVADYIEYITVPMNDHIGWARQSRMDAPSPFESGAKVHVFNFTELSQADAWGLTINALAKVTNVVDLGNDELGLIIDKCASRTADKLKSIVGTTALLPGLAEYKEVVDAYLMNTSLTPITGMPIAGVCISGRTDLEHPTTLRVTVDNAITDYTIVPE